MSNKPSFSIAERARAICACIEKLRKVLLPAAFSSQIVVNSVYQGEIDMILFFGNKIRGLVCSEFAKVETPFVTLCCFLHINVGFLLLMVLLDICGPKFNLQS